MGGSGQSPLFFNFYGVSLGNKTWMLKFQNVKSSQRKNVKMAIVNYLLNPLFRLTFQQPSSFYSDCKYLSS